MQKIQELIVNQAAAQKDRLFLWVPFCLALGIGIYFGLKNEPPILLGASFFCLSIGAVFLMWRTQETTLLHKSMFLMAFAFSIVALGLTVAQIKTHISYTPMIVKKMTPVGLVGTIKSIEPMEEGSRAVLNDLEIERLTPEQTPRKIRLRIRKDDGLAAGQRVQLLAGLNPPSPPVAPGAFDFQQMAYFQGIGAVGFSYNAPEILETGKTPVLESLRRKISDTIQVHTTGPQQPVLVALMTGQRKAIRDEDWEALRESGLAHMLAISGLHVGMVAGVLFFFCRLLLALSSRLALHYPIKKWAAIVALVGACFYTLIVGATIPTQRALMMTGLVMIAILFDRSPFSLRLVALAACIVLLISPESLMSVSFQMSFAAVTALICFFDWLRPVWKRFYSRAGIMRRALLYFTGVSLTTLIAGTATGLFALYHFQQYALYSLLANIVAVPILAFIVMPMMVLSYVLMPLGLDSLSLSAAEWGIGWILATAHYVSGMEGAVWRVSTWPVWIFVSMVIVMWFWIVWQGKLKHIALPVFVVLTLLAFLYRQPDIQVGEKIDLVALKDKQNKIWLSTGQKSRYTAENWQRRNGQEKEKKKKSIWPREGEKEGFPLACGTYGCRGNVNGQKVAIAFSVKASQEDCNWADILIADRPVDKNCRAENVIDYFDVWRHGPHAIWLSPQEIKIRTVEEVRGNRLWTQTAAKRN